MQLSLPAIQAAVGALRQISEDTSGERARRAAVVALVLRSVEALAGSSADADFLGRRAAAELDQLEKGQERSILRRVLNLAIGREVTGLGDVLSDYAGALEEARRLPEADAVITLARELDSRRADVALRAGRIARLLGDRERALDLYRTARGLDSGDGAMARLAAIGEAVIAEDPERAISTVIRAAILAADAEAAAVALEERGRIRRIAGNRSGAARDFAFAAARFEDAVDRARVAHLLADLFVASGDPEAAREALLFALKVGDRSQKDHAQARLHTVSRDLGDQIGMRRWRSFQRPALVSLSSRPGPPSTSSAAPAVARWLKRVEALAETTA